MTDYVQLEQRLRECEQQLISHIAIMYDNGASPEYLAESEADKSLYREAADAIASLTKQLEEQKRRVLFAIDEERLCDPQDDDGDRAYNQAVADCYASVERVLSRAADEGEKT